MDEPTADMCTRRARLQMSDGRPGYAAWWPQMGGYAGKSIIVVDDDGCFDVYVWHDGDFPFNGDGPYRETPNPRLLHISDGGQFIAFGEFLNELAEDHGG